MRRPSRYRILSATRSESAVNQVLALFTPDADGTWTLRLVSAHPPGFRLPGVDIGGKLSRLRRPDLEQLNVSMLRARAGYIVRTHPAGGIEVSASDSSAEVLNEWLVQMAGGAGADAPQ